MVRFYLLVSKFVKPIISLVSKNLHGDSVTKVVGFEGWKEKRASCKMVIAKSNQMQGARHDNCGAETAGCQAENRREAQAMSVL
jgi:hypothetical protein